MKGILGLAAAALILFSLSAALSLWLNRPTGVDTAKDESKGTRKATEKEPPEAKPKPGDPPNAKPSPLPAGPSETEADRLRVRAARISLVQADLLAEREALDELQRKVIAATKEAATKAEAEVKTPPALPKAATPSLSDADLKKNAEQLSRTIGQMPAKDAAGLIRTMADTGKLDQAVQILAGMQDRQLAPLLAELQTADTNLATQLIERVLRFRRTAPPPPTP